jgi:1-phosphatidylinositol phosphodiesterase
MLKIIKNIVLLLALFVLSIANNLSAHSDKGAYNHNWHNDKPYNTGSGLNNSARWMEEISDNVYLSQLALPGTHDSFTGADDNQHHNVCRTQAYGATITNQLKAGIRVLDLRIFLENTEVKLRHGNTNFCGSPLTLISTINEINNFLKYIGPKETLIVMISHESKDRVSAELKEKTTHIIRRSTQFYKMP